MAEEVDSNETNGNALVVAAVLFLVISYMSVILRTYVRTILTNAFRADDWLMLVAQVNYTLSCSFILAGVGAGLGHHNAALEQQKETESLKWQALATATYIPNMMFIKLSIGIFLLRLASQNIYKYIIWGSLGVVAIMSTVLFFWNLFQCSPVQAQWDNTIPNLKCVTSEQIIAAAYSLSIMTILTDWLYALLPIPMIWRVKMSAQAKLTVSVVLGLGIFASIATLVRLKFLADLNDTDDILFAGTDAMVWTLVEPGVAITAASLVTIRPLLRAWKLKGFESTDRYGSRRYGMRSGGTGTASGVNNKPGHNRGMPGFGSDDYTTGDVELGSKDFSSATITPAVQGDSGPFAGALDGSPSYNINPSLEAPRRPGRVRPLSRISEGTMGVESQRSARTQFIGSPASRSPATPTNPFELSGPLPNGPLNSNPGPFAPPPTRPPQNPLPVPPQLQRPAPPSPKSYPSRSTVKSETYVIEGERERPMSRDDMAWVARHQHPGWEDRRADESIRDGMASPSTESVDTLSWMEVQGQRVGGGSITSPVERPGGRARDGAYGPL